MKKDFKEILVDFFEFIFSVAKFITGIIVIFMVILSIISVYHLFQIFI